MTIILIWYFIGVVVAYITIAFINDLRDEEKYGKYNILYSFMSFLFIILFVISSVLIELIPKAIDYKPTFKRKK